MLQPWLDSLVAVSGIVWVCGFGLDFQLWSQSGRESACCSCGWTHCMLAALAQQIAETSPSFVAVHMQETGGKGYKDADRVFARFVE